MRKAMCAMTRGRNRAAAPPLIVVGWIVIVLPALLVGGCSGDSETSEASGSELPDSVQAVIDEYLASWQEQNIDGWEATITDDYIYHGHLFSPGTKGQYAGGPDDWGARERATNIEIKNPQVAEWMGDKVVVGDGPWFVSVQENWVDAEAGVRFDGVATYVIVEQDDGTMKINSHTYAGTGSGTEG